MELRNVTGIKNPPPVHSLVYTTALTLIIGLGTIVRINTALKHRFPQGDEGPWLRCAATVGTDSFMVSPVVEHDMDPHRLPPRPEDNRWPLYPVLIAAAGLVTGDLMRAGQTVNILAMIFLCLTAAAILRRRYGRTAALIATLLLCASPLFIVYSAQIYPDILVCLCFLIVVHFGGSFLLSTPRALLGGMLLGGAALLKSTVLTAIPALIAQALLSRAGASGILRRLIIVIAVTTAILFPWMVRNINHFDSPLYQFASTTLYTDTMEEVFRVGIERPDFSSYVKARGWFFVAAGRPIIGLLRLVREAPGFDHRLSLCLLLPALAGIWSMRKRKNDQIPALCFLGVFLPLMAYVAYGSWVGRYTMIFYVWLYMSAAAGLCTIAARLTGNRWIRITITAGCTALLLLPVVYPLEFYASGRGCERDIDTHARAIIDQAGKKVMSGETVLSSFASSYSHLHPMRVVNRLAFKSWKEVESVMINYSVTHALLHTGSDRDLIDLIETSQGAIQLTELSRAGPFALFRVQMTVGG